MPLIWNLELIWSALYASLQVDKAAADLKITNVRLKDTVNQVIELSTLQSLNFYSFKKHPDLGFFLNLTQVSILFQLRSSRNFCIDIVLLIIILGIAAYLYK